MKKIPPTLIQKKKGKYKIFYRNSDKRKAMIFLAFLLTLILSQSFTIGYLITQKRGCDAPTLQ